MGESEEGEDDEEDDEEEEEGDVERKLFAFVVDSSDSCLIV